MNVVVTGGATIAPIDDVRYLTNVSSGRFSARITEAFLARGATVWHIHGPHAVLPFDDRARLRLDAEELHAEISRLRALHAEYAAIRGESRLHCQPILKGRVEDYSSVLHFILTSLRIDIAVLAMAVSDYEPEREWGKVSSDRQAWTLTLHRTEKVIQSVRDWAPGVFLVGFKLLHDVSSGLLIETAREATIANRADLTVANDLKKKDQGQHTLHIVDGGGVVETLGPGDDLAVRLVDRLIARYESPSRGGP
jgi:phosphopantothenate---cysteine ligase (CTP)